MEFFISARHRSSSLFLSPSFTWICLLSLPCISATDASSLDLTFNMSSPTTWPDRYVIENVTGSLQVINPTAKTFIPQGPATDGGGSNFDAPALLWLVFSFGVGLPMSFAGFRGWKLSTGAGVGLTFALISWATFINSIQASNSTDLDLIITIVVLVLFVGGFWFGVLESGRIAGTFLLGFTGGLAFGIRVMILKSNLLISNPSLFPLTWFLIVVCGVAGGASVWWKKAQRIALLLSCASIGTFLISLGVDLVVNKQRGMSRGLRFLFDRNSAHFLDIVVGGYTPPLSTQIIIGATLGIIPILALAQHYIFKQPFQREDLDLEDDPEEKDFYKGPIPDGLQKRRDYNLSF